jgi:hypothetical protein
MPLGSSFVSSLNRLGFGHVFAFFRGPVEMRAFLVVNMRLGVDPNQAVASARRGRFRRCLSAGAFRWGWGRGRGTGCCRRSPRFEQIAEVEFTW